MVFSLEERACIEHAKSTGQLELSSGSKAGLAIEQFTSAAHSLYRKGLLEGRPKEVDQGYVIFFALKSRALDLI